MAESNTGHIEPVSIEEEIRKSYMDYAMSVIVGRALPDVRDGLKPVHRRILYAMHEMGNTYNRAYKKSARVVGNVIGKYHPHGDSAVYDALVRLAQPFNMRLPLIDGQGNFGSVDGDPPAAMRYTEVRMERACGQLMADIDKETVDFIPNYDDAEFEPTVLPTKIPNLLINGSNGIAVGMATNIPPHNLGEVMTGAIELIRNPELTVDDLMTIIPAPDFPTAGTIYGRKGIIDAYRTGRGIIRIRARACFEESNGRSAIIVTELPYQVNKARLLEKTAQLVKDKKLEGIHDLRDESDRSGMRVVIELKRDANEEIILNQLYKLTSMQSSFGINMLAIVAGQPQTLDLKEILGHFIEFRRDVTIRRSIFLLRKAKERAHILEGLKIALDNLDAVIQLIRESAGPIEARDGLMSAFGLSERQAQAVLDMRLQRLTGLERDKILEELAELRAEISRLEEILASKEVRDALIVAELIEARDLFTTPRLTDVVDAEGEIDLEDLIADEEMIVTVSHQGYIKRLALSEYQAQKRGGRGKMGMNTKDDDFVEDLFVATAHQRLFVFTTEGRVFQLKVYELPLGTRTTKGRPIITLLPRLAEEEKIAAVLPIPKEDKGLFVMTATQNGIVKKTDLDAYQNINVAGLIAVNIREGDHLVTARLLEAGQSVFLATESGMAIHFDQDDVRPVGRASMGVYGIKLREGDQLIAMEIIQDPNASLLTVTQNGYGKRTPVTEYKLQNRGGIGIITIKTSERNGGVVGVRQVYDHDHLLLVTNKGTIIRTRVSEIAELGRNTQGVTLIRTSEDESVVALARVVDEPEIEGEELEAAETQAEPMEDVPNVEPSGEEE